MGDRSLLRCLSLIVILSSLHSSWGDFRFCSKGPQRIRDRDCPGGFFAHTPINTTCAYYKAGQFTPAGSKAQLVQSFCEDSKLLDLPEAGDSIAVDKFQEFSIHIESEEANGAEYVEPTQCGEECLTEWRDPDEIQPEDHLIDKPPINETVEPADFVKNRSKEVAKKMMMHLLIDETYEEDDPNQVVPIEDPLYNPNLNTTQRLTLLLTKAMQITIKNCDPYVQSNFLTQVLKGMIYLYSLSKKTPVDIGIDEFYIIDEHLDKCLNAVNDKFRLVGRNCTSYYKVQGIRYFKFPEALDETWQYRITSRSFVWGEYDPVVEAAFAVIDFVHGYCFPIFTDNFPHYHIFHTGLEALFPKDPIMQQWANPVDLASGPSFWNSVLDTVDIEVAMRNLDACAIAGIYKTPYQHRLERFFTVEDQLANPTFKPIPYNSESGWTKSIEEYWAWYDRNGGFSVLGNNLGMCVGETEPDPSKRQDTIRNIIQKNCPSVEAPPLTEEDDDYRDPAAV